MSREIPALGLIKLFICAAAAAIVNARARVASAEFSIYGTEVYMLPRYIIYNTIHRVYINIEIRILTRRLNFSAVAAASFRNKHTTHRDLSFHYIHSNTSV